MKVNSGCPFTAECMNRGTRVISTPAASLSTKNRVAARSGPASAWTSRKSAMSPQVTNHFSPLSSQPPSVRVAVLAHEPGSEPAPGSVTANASKRSPRMTGSRYFSRCASVPWARTFAGRQGMSHRQLVTLPNSSSTMTWSSRESPAPPHSAGMLMA